MAQKPRLGIVLPVQRGSVGFFNQTTEAIVQVKSNLTNLILTKKGERVMLPTFGCGIHSLVFDHITDNLVANVRGTIEQAVQTWMPFVTINDVKVIKDEDHNRVFVTIVFSLKSGVKVTDTITLVI